MTAEDMVDASLAGLDQHELVTIPALPDSADWEKYDAARKALGPDAFPPKTRSTIRHPRLISSQRTHFKGAKKWNSQETQSSSRAAAPRYWKSTRRSVTHQRGNEVIISGRPQEANLAATIRGR